MKEKKGQVKERKWRISDIGKAIANSLVAIVKGQFILRLKIDKYFLQIAWTFFLFARCILFGLGVDVTLAKVENNKKQLQELEILHTQKRYELITLGRRSTVTRLLKDCGSEVTEPVKPATILEP